MTFPLPIWCCTYIKRGREFCITLPGTDPEQLVEDNKHLLRGLRVDGRLVAEYPAGNAKR